MTFFSMISAVCGTAVCAQRAAADTVDVELTGISAQSLNTAMGKTSFSGPSFTGSVALTKTSSTALIGVLINGDNQTFTGGLSAFSGQINFVTGKVTSGSFSVSVNDNGATDSLTAVIVPTGTSGVTTFTPYIAFGDSSPVFSGTTFAGVNVSEYQVADLPSGGFDLSSFATSGTGPATDAFLDLSATASPSTTVAAVGLPKSVRFAAVGLTLIGAVSLFRRGGSNSAAV